MAASPRFVNPPRRYRSKRPTTTLPQGRSRSSSPVPSQAPRPVPRQPQARTTANPLLVRLILFLQHSSSAIACALMSAVLLAYASTVYIQQQWSEEYRQLETLQREMRNLTAADAIFKDNLAQQAEKPETGLVMPTPDNNIYLSP
ncbi:MAG: hypothetical protein SAJ11_18240, partial [Jaaginema sp. PMC 1078.18]|nr:hypothetical protein [Jaaginema sp. PMC 1078.18]